MNAIALLTTAVFAIVFQDPAQLSIVARPTKVVEIKSESQPEIYGKTVVAEGLTGASVVSAAKVVVEHNMKFVDVTARKSIQESGTLDQISIAPGVVVYILTGTPGDYLIEAVAFDPELGIKRQQIVVKIEGTQPVPPGPGPGPGPEPTPDPAPNVLNDYNVGLVAFQNAPKDPALALKIAGFYKDGADRLFGQSGISDIQTVIRDIDRKFQDKQCTDQESCRQWNVWKNEVTKALALEQQRRKFFTRDNWFFALNEIASALEQVK
jgi:hypothetical protein